MRWRAWSGRWSLRVTAASRLLLLLLQQQKGSGALCMAGCLAVMAVQACAVQGLHRGRLSGLQALHRQMP